MKILLLGSSGQIGSHLSLYLKNKKYDVINFDISENEGCDLRIKNVLDDIIKDVDFVLFMAFDVGGAKYLKDKQNTFEFIDNNVNIMTNTFNTIKKYKKNFIFASSQMSSILDSSYGNLKRIGEFYTESLSGVFVRFWNVYGYEHHNDKSHVITDFIDMAKNKNEIVITGDGSDERQFLYVKDCCECLEFIMINYNTFKQENGIDISSFKWNTVMDLAKIISSNFNNCNIQTTFQQNGVPDREKETPNNFILKFWQPKTSIEDGIKEIISKTN
jgi:nucleoside-diphosphate-sugar epimerase